MAKDALKEKCEKLIKDKIKPSQTKKIYNILAVDGGGIRGLIPGAVIVEIEKFAYEYAKKRGITKNKEFQECFQYPG